MIAAIIRRADTTSGLHQDDNPLFRMGEPIRLVEGPLAGMEGVFNQEDGEKSA
ncbi:MAG: hypothetical protein PHE55_13710 [Methylococcaceae bacterium]|nr:hypothetical protein [Methylococcaceae bacterium]